MELPFDPAIPLLGLYPENPATLNQNNLCIWIFIAALFTIAKWWWKRPKCPSGNEWIKEISHIYTWNTTQQKERRNTYSSIQHGWNWRVIMLSEISQVVKDKSL